MGATDGQQGRDSQVAGGTFEPRFQHSTAILVTMRTDFIRKTQALAVMAQPSCVPTSVQELAKLSDEIWFLAGDKSVDSTWYTKRATLSMVYSTTELFMTNDTSHNFIDTNNFLRRRLDEVKSIGGVVGSFGQWAGFTLNAGVNVLRSKGLRI